MRNERVQEDPANRVIAAIVGVFDVFEVPVVWI